MALSQLYTAITGDVITAARWNNEFGNIYSNSLSLISPLTGTLNANSNNITNVVNLSFAASGSITGTCQINTTTVGPYSFGAASNADVGFLISGAQATGTAMGVQISSTTVPATGESSYGLNVIPTLTEFSSGVHTLLAGIRIAPVITAGAGTVTTAAGIAIDTFAAQTTTTTAAAVYISAAPTGATDNFAIYIAGGNVRLAAASSLGTSAGMLTGPRIGFDSTTFDFVGGTTSTRWVTQDNSTVLLTLANGGLLTLALGGITVSTAAPATPAAKTLYEDSIVKGWVRFNAAGTIADDLNVSSITDNGAGDWTVNWATAFASANYGCTVVVGADAALTVRAVAITSIGVGTVRILSVVNDTNASVVAADPSGTDAVFLMAVGNN
mgnify:FL=1